MVHEGELCDEDDGPECDWREDLECVGGVCVAPVGLGQACSGFSGCTDDLWCNQVSGLCEQRAIVGEACNNFDGPECTWDLWCDSRFDDGLCHDLSGAGDVCLDDYQCEASLACHPDPGDPMGPGTCDPPAGTGADCDTEEDCQEPLACVNEVCGTAPDLGEQCQLDNCAAGLTCEGSTCLNARYPGDACGDADSVCVNSLCIQSLCEPRAPLGGACQEDYDCASRTCDGVICVDDNDCSP